MKGNKETETEEVKTDKILDNLNRFYPERAFLWIAILVGSLLIFITPPIAVSDEGAHFINAYAVSKGDFIVDVQDGKPGIQLPKDFMSFVNQHMRYCGQGQIEQKYNFKEYINDSWNPINYKDNNFYTFSQRSLSPIGYLISGFGMFIGQLLCRSYSTPYNLLLFGRIFNLIFYITVTYLAIKITPYFKRTMLLLSLMPTSIFLAASLSYDAIVIPISFLTFAYVFKLFISSESYIINNKDLIIILFASFFLGGIKPIYLPLLLTLLALPQNKFKSKKHYYLCVLLVIIVSVCAYIIPTYFIHLANEQVTLGLDKYEIMQKSYLYSNLDKIPSIIFNTFKKETPFLLKCFFGELGWFGTYFPIPLIIIFYFVLMIVVLMDCSKANRINIFTKILSGLAVIISISGMFYYIYVSWTSQVLRVGANYVSGLQGRYFIPVALFICLLFSNSFLQKHPIKYESIINRKVDMMVTFTPAVLGLLTVTTVLLRFWW